MSKRVALVWVVLALTIPPFLVAWVPPMAGHWHCQEIYLSWLPILPSRFAIGFQSPEGVLAWILAVAVPALLTLVLVHTLVRRPRFGAALLAVVAIGNLIQAGQFIVLLRM